MGFVGQIFFPYDYAELPCLNYQCLASGIDT